MDKNNIKTTIAISIIIPVYNAEKYLYRCFESILKQSFDNYEVLIVNDGSTDQSQNIIDEYTKNYSSKFKSFSKENGGQSSARNLALQFVNGEYVTFLDSDDYWDEKYLETLYQAARIKDSDMVISGQKKVDETGKVYMSIDYDIEKFPGNIMRRLNFSGKLYRTSFMQKHKMKFAEGKTYEDNPFNLIMIFLAKNLAILNYSGYYQVGHIGSTTTKKICEEKLPYKEIEDSIAYVLNRKSEVNDITIFEYTVLSFFTYFIFYANKRHMYLSINDRKSDIEVINHLCTYVSGILKRYFPHYWENCHVGIFKNPELAFQQRAGVWFFTRLCRWELLSKFATIYYAL